MSRILIVGGGAREHALGTALRGHTLSFAPGNGGTDALGTNVALAADDVDGIVAFAVAEKIDLVVVGPEKPLTLGLVDALEARGVRAFGPSRDAARLEGSKAFMKTFLAECEIPTAAHQVFTDANAALAFVRAANRPLVVKADGLCAGKGVVVATDPAEAADAVVRMMVKAEFGDAGRTVVIEELLAGEEASFHVVCDGQRAVALVAAQDHKRVSDGDAGPNTGGMGAYAPAPIVTEAVAAIVMKDVVAPTLTGMARRGTPFRGVLFVGLMIDRGVPSVLEFNVRFGDPETTVLVPMLDGDWFSLLAASAAGDLSAVNVKTKAGAALSVVLASEGYPAAPVVGDAIEGLDAAMPDGAMVFHAGTRRDGGRVVTSGGRVLCVCGAAASFDEARRIAYEGVARVTFRGEHHRTDIGHRALAGSGARVHG